MLEDPVLYARFLPMMSHLEKKKIREKINFTGKKFVKKSNLRNRMYPQTVVLPILTVVKRRKKLCTIEVCVSVCEWSIKKSQKVLKTAKLEFFATFGCL